MNCPLDYVDDEEKKYIDKLSRSEKHELYVWVKRGILHKLSYSKVVMKSYTHLLQFSPQECVVKVLKW